MHLPERDGVYADLLLLDLFLREQEEVEQQIAYTPCRAGGPRPKHPDSSAPIIAPVSTIFGPMNLKPTGVSNVSMS